MKKQRLLLLGVLLCSLNLIAQEDPENVFASCAEKMQRAEAIMTGIEMPLSKGEHMELINECMAIGSSEALHLYGLMHLGSYNFPTPDESVAFKYIEKAAQLGNADAMCNLAILHKMGRGTKIDFDKALELHEQAFHMGSTKSAFKIGYIYFKGLGTVDQDYDKAIEWFSKSEYPFAQHFLAICNYFGYGMPVNKEAALVLLQESPQPGSRRLHYFLNKDYEINPTADLDIEEEALVTIEEIQNEAPTIEEVVEEDAIVEENEEETIEVAAIQGNWIGKLVEFDWSKEKILRSFPAALSLATDKDTSGVAVSWEVNGEKQVDVAIPLDKSLYFDKIKMNLERLYKDAMGYDFLNYKVLSGDITRKQLGGKDYLVIDITSQVTNWKEPAPPMQLILQRKEQVVASNGEVLTDEMLEALANSKDGFISLYPNPFQTDLLIEYELETQSTISVTVHSYLDQSTITLEQGKLQDAGKYVYHLDGTNMDKGLYIVRVTANETAHTKMIVKE